MVVRCNNAASAIKKTKRAWRVGGGLMAGASRRVSSMLKVRAPVTIDSLGCPAGALGDRRARASVCFGCRIFFPVFRKTQKFSRWHLDKGQRLAAFGDQRIIFRTNDAECAPKSRPFQLVEPAFDHESIAEFGGASIVDLSAHDDGIFFVFDHLREAEAEFLSEQRPSDLDEAQIGDVVHDASAIGIEKHYSHFGANAWRIGGEHAEQSFRKAH